MTPIWPHVAILSFVTLQRLAELPMSRANTARLLAAGGREVAPGHYPLIVALHVAWLACLWLVAPGRPIEVRLLMLYGLFQLLRVWTIRALGPRFTTRILVVPGETLVTSGPYRFLHHPNYLIVIGELAVLPLVFGLIRVAIVFTLLNLPLIAWRIRAEDRALGR